MHFDYHRSIAPLLWVLVVLSSVELGVAHLLVGLLLGWKAALVLSAVTAAGLLSLIAFIRSFRRYPVLVGPDTVVLRVGRRRSIEVPVAAISRVRRDWEGGAHKQRGTMNLALATYPNLLIELDPPLRRKGREVRAVAHRLDAPGAFIEALGR